MVIVCAFAAAAALVGGFLAGDRSPTPRETLIAASSRCAFESAPQPVSIAFCDTFAEAPTTNPDGSRSAQLNGTLWGVSRELGANNLGQHQYDAGVDTLQIGGTCQPHAVTIESDIQLCNGAANDVVNDNLDVNAANAGVENGNGGVTSLAMYPKQPFDFAHRTGTVVFDVSDDSGGMHTAWPEFWVTDLPVPDPFVHFNEWQSVPEYGFGLRLGGACTPAGTGGGSGGGECGPHCPSNNTGYVVTVASAVVVNHYRVNDSDTGDTPPQNKGTLRLVPAGCVTEPTRPGQMNHFEIRVNRRRIAIYATNAFTPPFDPAVDKLVRLATVPNAHLGFTRGLIWLEDAHYNANKAVDPKLQAMHTFSWANVGFDGPTLPRDLTFDVPDADQPVPGYPGLLNLGWAVPAGRTPLRLTVPNVTGTASAIGALLTFNYGVDTAVTLTYRVNNGRRRVVRWPFGVCAVQNGLHVCGERTIAVPVALRGIKTGANLIRIHASGSTFISNVDLILRGAGGIVAPAPDSLAAGPA